MMFDNCAAQQLRFVGLAIWVVVPCVFSISAVAQDSIAPEEQGEERFLAAVKQFADNALKHGADTYGEKKTPLLADGLEVESRQPLKWKRQGTVRIVSNFATQQNLLRTLVGLSALSGEEKYRARAAETTRYAFDHLTSPSGLIYWGGHCMYDLESDRSIMGKTFDGQSYSHELACHYPYYEFLAEVDREATTNLLESMWAAHVTDWRKLATDRHGDFHAKKRAWAGEFREQPPFFLGRGLSSVTTCSDLIYAGAFHHQLTGQEQSLEWTSRLAEYFARARDPKTGLGSYRYTQEGRLVSRKDPETGEVKTVPLVTDIIHLLMGDKYGDTALQGKLLYGGRVSNRLAKMPIVHLRVAEVLGADGDWYLKTAIEDLVAFDTHMYDRETNLHQPMFNDGTKLDPDEDAGELTKEQLAKIRRYYPGFQGRIHIAKERLLPQQTDSEFFFAAARAYRLSGDERMWKLAASVAKGQGLPDLTRKTGLEDPKTDCSDPVCLFALLELYRRDERADLLALAEQIGDNILRDRFVEGFFLPSRQHVYAQLDAAEPLALLHLVAAIQKKPDVVPTYMCGRGYYRAAHDGMIDSQGRKSEIYDIKHLYPQTKSEKRSGEDR